MSTINTTLLVLIFLVNAYVIGAPFAPALVFRWQNHSNKRAELTTKLHPPENTPAVQPTPSETRNQLTIPSALLNGPILEGPVSRQYKTLDQGIWRWPASSTPDKGSNTVLIGHRFTYTNPKGVFYHLDKAHVGDEIGVQWNLHHYMYKVSSVREVLPTETSIQDPTEDARLTLFTCTPLWLPKHRLVVVAQLESRL